MADRTGVRLLPLASAHHLVSVSDSFRLSSDSRRLPPHDGEFDRAAFRFLFESS